MLVFVLWLSCAQQNNTAMEAEDFAEMEVLEELREQSSYLWLEQELVVEETINDEQLNSWTKKDLANKNESDLSANLTEKNQNELSAIEEEQLLIAFVKQNVADLLDLCSLYNEDTYSGGMQASVEDEITKSLANEDFNSFKQSLFFNTEEAKKLSFVELETLSDSEFVGVFQINTSTELNRVAFKVSTLQMEFGNSRKFEILDIVY